jgi:hypothetical protein
VIVRTVSVAVILCASIAIVILGLPSQESEVAAVTDPLASIVSSATLGPFLANTPVTCNGLRIEFSHVEVQPTSAISQEERLSFGLWRGVSSTATPTYRYVDVSFRLSDAIPLSSNALSSDVLFSRALLRRIPVLPGTYVIADGVGYAERARGMATGHPDQIEVEYELPEETREAILCVPIGDGSLPASEAATQVVSFRLW